MPIRSRLVLTLAVVVLVVSRAAASESAAVSVATPPASREARAEALLRAYSERHGVPGLSAAVGVVGEPVWSRAIGVAGRGDGRELSPDSVFPIGSTTKAITALALGRLVDEGRLDLDAPIQRYVPSFPWKDPRDRPITARLLAGHLAGIRNYDMAKGEYANSRAYESIEAALAPFRDDPLLHAPGERHAYSVYGFVLLSAAIERAAGKEFLAYVRESITAPLGLDRTGPDVAGSPAPGRVDGHVRGPFGAVVTAGPVDVSNKWAAGGFVSTPSEMVRLGIATLEGRVVRPATLELLTTPQRQADGSENPGGYALGFRSGRTKLPGLEREVRVAHHGGVAHGAVSFFVLLPDERMAIAVQANLQVQPFDLHELAYALASTFLDPSAASAARAPAGLSSGE